MKNAIAVFDTIADKYHDMFKNVEVYAQALDVFCRLLPSETPKVLDLACGPANLSYYVKSNINTVNIMGVDGSQNMLDIAQNVLPDEEFRCMNVLDVDKLGNVKFDGILAGFVLPYLSIEEIKSWFKDLFQLLKEGGVFYFSFMDTGKDVERIVYSSSGEGPGLYTRFHTLETIEKALGAFSTVSKFEYPNPKDSSVVDRVIVVAK